MNDLNIMNNLTTTTNLTTNLTTSATTETNTLNTVSPPSVPITETTTETITETTTETTNTNDTNKINLKSNLNRELKCYEGFEEMDLDMNLLRGIFAYGFEKPSPIQKRAIMPIVEKFDVIGQAQSGTGKTGTFLIGTLQRIDTKENHVQALILAPTRELSEQIQNVCNSLSIYTEIKSYLLIGGNSRSNDMKNLEKNNYHVIIGTPGRVFDMLKNFAFNSKYLRLFVLDEADEMLSKGFQDQIYEIFQYVPKTSQVCLFSATMPEEALEITDRFMNNPIRILIKKEQLTLDGIKQFYIAIDKEIWKLDTLCDIYGKLSISQSIIYCNTKRTSDWLKEQLEERDFTVNCIHSNMKSEERKQVMKDFRNGDSRVLIATDIISRGIDVQQVSIVINYDIPKFKDVYIHRIGRSGRFGRKGLAINFVTYDDVRKLKAIQEYYETEIEEMPEDISEFI